MCVDPSMNVPAASGEPAPARWLCCGRSACLVVLKGPGVGDIHHLDRNETIVGRGPSADIRLLDGAVSRRHAVLTFDGALLAIEDLGSRNGTYVGIRRVKERRYLSDGDAISLGPSTLMEVTFVGAVPNATPCHRHHPDSCETSESVKRTSFLLDRLATACSVALAQRRTLSLVFFRVDAVAAMSGSAARSVLANEMMGAAGAAIYETLGAEDVVGRSGPDAFLCLVRAEGPRAAETAERVRGRFSRAEALTVQAFGRQTLTAIVVPIEVVGVAVDAGTVFTAASRVANGALRDSTDRVVLVPSLIVGDAPRRRA